MVNHVEEDNDDGKPTLREIATKAALLRRGKKAPKTRRDGSSQGIGEHPNTELPQHPNTNLPLDLFNVEENEKEPAFLPRDPKDLLIDSMRKKLEEKDKDISNLHSKLDEVLEMFSNMQTHMGVQLRNPKVQVIPPTLNLSIPEDEFTSSLEDNADDGVEEGDSEKQFWQKLERKKKEEQGSTAYAQRATNYRLDSVNEELFNIRVEQKEIAKMVIRLEARIEQVLRLMAPAPRRVRPPPRNNRLQEMMERIERMIAPNISQGQTTENVSSQDLRIIKIKIYQFEERNNNFLEGVKTLKF
uniref:Uncharacterized protein n=1 Tax=Ananas comosus var. bracteatus TaxID=296719 RepID=A0A6V7PL77_ANACO|nr:unnamed protein product [Ananas comosus var. bracteatus]